MDMCRFSGLEDPEYRKVVDSLTSILQRIGNRMQMIDRDPSPARRQIQEDMPPTAESDSSSPDRSPVSQEGMAPMPEAGSVSEGPILRPSEAI
jgi:hypothetical protein